MGLLDRLFRRDPPAPERRHFDAATGGRRGSHFARFGSYGPETLAAAGQIRSRARHVHANFGYVRNAVDAIVAETVGAGIEATSTHPDQATRAAIDAHFLARVAEVDAEGRTDLRGLVAAMVRAEVVDGEAFALIEGGPDGVRLRQIPAEFVDSNDTRDLTNGGYVVAGIEFAADGTRRAYQVRPHRPTDVSPTSGEAIRVPAEDMLHLARSLGPGQPRGMSQLAPVITATGEYDCLQDALLMGARISACHAGFIQDLNSLTGGGPYLEAVGDPGEVSLEPGVLRRLAPGESITFNSPEQAKDSIAFAKLILGQIAAGLGVPQHLLDSDLSGANYSSLRAGLLPFRAKIEQYTYHTLIPQVLDPVFRRVVTHEYLAGRLDLADLEPALKAEWLPPKPMQVDPQKDAATMREMMAAGLMSRRQAVASLGWNVDQLDAEIAADRERERDLSLTFGGDQ